MSDAFEELRMRTDITADDWISGPLNAPITLLEYGDFECSYCGRAELPLREVRARYAGRLRFVWRHFPITSRHPHAQDAAMAAEAAGAQGKFWFMHDLLLARQDHLDPADLRSYAAELGLDLERFDRELRERVYLQAVKQDFRDGALDGVNGTPTLFINGLRYDGPRTTEELARAIETVRNAVAINESRR